MSQNHSNSVETLGVFLGGYGRIKLFWIAVFTAIASFVLLSDRAQAANPDHVRRLLQTNSCKGCDLRNAQLLGLDLTHANLAKVNLEGANLSGAHLIRANLRGANLRNAVISRADFSGANLRQADLSNAQNGDLCLNPIIYGFQTGEESGSLGHRKDQRCLAFSLMGTLGTALCSPEFGYGELQEGKSFCQLFKFSEGSEAPMIGEPFNAFFKVTSFLGADLTEATLNAVDFTATNFRYANLSGASLQNSTLTYALMLDANLEGISEEQIQPAFVTTEDIKETIQKMLAIEQVEHQARRKIEAISNVGTVLRAQQAYHLENAEFSDDLARLDTRIPVSENYNYILVPQGDRTKAIITATSLVDFLPSFMGVIIYRSSPEQTDERLYRIMICETSTPATSLPTIPGSIGTDSCPSGMIKIR